MNSTDLAGKALSQKSDLRHAALALVTLLLNACASVPATQSTAEQIVRFDPQTLQAVQKNFESLGWLYLGSSTKFVASGETMHFVNPNTVSRFGNVARVHSFMSNAVKSSKSGMTSMALQVQYDCVARTAQILTIDAYADNLAKTPILALRTPDKVEPIVANSVNDAILVAACTGRLESLAKGQSKALADKIRNGSI
jgi:hypothetical protein